MTQEEKARRYDEAIERAKKINREHSKKGFKPSDDVMYIFPELKENGDEEIRKAVIYGMHALKGQHKTCFASIPIDNVIAWLEKQDKKVEPIESFNTEFERQVSCLIASAINKEYEYTEAFVKYVSNTLLNYAKHEIEKQGEQLSDKIKPKFHKGEWIVCCDYEPVQIIGIRTNTYYEMSNGDIRPIYMVDNNHNIRLWTIQDAKKGDILVDKYNNIGIFKKCEGIYWHSYIYLGCDGELRGIAGMYYPHSIAGMHEQTDIHPATKEQCDALMEAMSDAGYTFDFENKELKKIEQNPAWSEEDIKHFRRCLGYIEAYVEPRRDDVRWFKSLKDRVGCEVNCTTTREWSEEDEKMLYIILNDINYAQKNFSDSKLIPYDRKVDWLKSIKDRMQPQKQ